MFTSSTLRPGVTVSGPNVAPPPMRIVTEPLHLTAQRMRDALYCTAPVGQSQLVAHLEMRGYDSAPASMERAFREVMAEGLNVQSVVQTISGIGVPLWTIPGQSR